MRNGGRLLVLSFSDLGRDPRVNRQVRFLAERYQVTAAGLGDPRVPGVSYVPLAPAPKSAWQKGLSGLRLLARRYESYYWQRSEVVDAWPRLRNVAADLVVANDIDTLPLALRVARNGARVLFDAHEYAPLEYEDRLTFRLLLQGYRGYLCRRYVPRAHAMTTVCDGLALAYGRFTGVHPEVLWNAPDFEPLEPRPVGKRIRLVHHGVALPGRRIEETLRLMDHLDERFDLTFLLTEGDPRYLEKLKRQAAKKPRVRLLAPVPMRELPRYLNAFDVGVFLLPPNTFQHRHALPNKFFEFVQARLAVAIGPSPEMARLAETHGFGVVAEDFTARSLAKRLSQLDSVAVASLKARSHAAARSLSADPGRERLLDLAAELLGQGADPARQDVSTAL